MTDTKPNHKNYRYNTMVQSELPNHAASRTDRLVISFAQELFAPFVIVHSILVTSALTLLQYPEFHPATTPLTLAAQGLLTNSALTSVAFLIGVAFLEQASAILKEMRERSESEADEPKPHGVSATLVVTLIHNLALAEFIVALLLWYCDQATLWRRCLMGVGFGVLVALATWTLLREAVHAFVDLLKKIREKFENLDRERQENAEEKAGRPPKGYVRRPSLRTTTI